MGYTKLREMTGREGIRRYGEEERYTLKGAALAFIRERCERLRFDDRKEEKEQAEGKYCGTSARPDQIPFNMEKDIDRLCLENALGRFLDSGRKEDAFDVYFCYLEMFVGDYAKTRRMIELLSEYEANGSRLLMKHRDHYAHSVYVFALGLAIYQTNDRYRQTYGEDYGFDPEDPEKARQAAHHYLQYWGMASLFHDIGYPFELPCEQAASYFEVNHQKRENQIYLSYHSTSLLTALQPDMQKKLQEAVRSYDGRMLHPGDKPGDKLFRSTDELFACALEKRLAGAYNVKSEYLCRILSSKPEHPDEFSYYMDHAYFSATMLFQKLFVENGIEPNEAYIDALTAILMHNSLYKFRIANPALKDGSYKEKGNLPFRAALHPLAYMLMLCDELQCWDRTAYGRDSRLQVHPFDCEFDFREGVTARYLYDDAERSKIRQYEEDLAIYLEKCEEYKKDYAAWENGGKKTDEPLKPKKPKLKAYDGMYRNGQEKSGFQKDIELIVDSRDIGGLRVEAPELCKPVRRTPGYLSDSSFVGLYNFALVLHNRWSVGDRWANMSEDEKKSFYLHENKERYIEEFNKISLEYKLSNIGQAKAFAKYLNEIGCFYSMNDIGLEMVEEFSGEELGIIGPMEHRRWLQEHCEMGWEYGEPQDKTEREITRRHVDMVPGISPDSLGPDGRIGCEAAEKNYARLGKEEQDKDTEPMKCMLKMLKMFDGLRIYRLPGRTEEK